MLRAFKALIATGLLVTSSSIGQAQYAATQDSTLKGVKRVYLNFADVNGALGAELATKIAEDAALELRKTGIRVVKNPAELDMREDAVLNVSAITDKDAWRSDLVLRIDLEQRAQLVRTQQTFQMVTWYYEKMLKTADLKVAARPMVAEGINKFITNWLDQNGR